MQIIESIEEIRELVQLAKRAGHTVGLVPTMGYLHDGHLSLVEAAKQRASFVVTSIFVNPLQFGPAEDLETYPRDLHRDLQLLHQQARCDAVFAPSVSEMYPRQMATEVAVPPLSRFLCGKSRPTHFQGVATVVSKLFHIVQPDIACFGQKDGQQLAIIRRLVQDLNIPTEIIGVKTLREMDGLARSSRNVYLSDEERLHATVLYRALQFAKTEIEAGNETSGSQLAKKLGEMIADEPYARLDYAEIVDMETLEPVDEIKGSIMIAVAVYFGKTRLIDNTQLEI